MGGGLDGTGRGWWNRRVVGIGGFIENKNSGGFNFDCRI